MCLLGLTQEKRFAPRLPRLQLANKTKFGCNGIGNPKDSIVNPMMIEIQLLIL
jgi:hypothetical protein